VILAVSGLCLLLVATWYVVCLPAAKVHDRPLPVVASVPAFTLTERSGRTVSREDLLGKVWVADFVFTTCTGPCPEMTLRMRSLQETLKRTKRDITLVTVTVDPVTDTPKVLQRYADKFGADPERWLFLTGDDERFIHNLVLKGFLQALAPATEDSPIIHSTRFVMIDRQGRIRGSHDGLDVEERDQLLHDLDKLLGEGRDGA
jgi:cytochrome oxidase Cu insertion factor (SCO1/SenC/PrrC family)